MTHLVSREVGGAAKRTTAIGLHNAVLITRAHCVKVGQTNCRTSARTGKEMNNVPVDSRMISAIPLRLQLIKTSLDVIGAIRITAARADHDCLNLVGQVALVLVLNVHAVDHCVDAVLNTRDCAVLLKELVVSIDGHFSCQ